MSTLVAAQTYMPIDNAQVFVDDKAIKYPWIGGLNSALINTLDLDGDSVEDLVVLEKTTSEIFTFRNANNEWVYAPELIALLPPISSWILTRDFNGDGRKDIFTAHPLGISLYINLPQGFELFSQSPLLSRGNFGNTNIYLTDDDIPAIDDIDSDGDLDILAMLTSGTQIVFHKNMQVELGASADTLIFQQENNHWGDIRICGCDAVVNYTVSCASTGGRTEHLSGHTLLLINLDGDQDLDLMYSDNHCNGVFLLENIGTPDQALLSENYTLLPETNTVFYPIPTYEDVNFDGVKDLVLSPGGISTFDFQQDLSTSVWVYRNTATDDNPSFSASEKGFLQNEMIDLGQNINVNFFDLDNDGDKDMIVGSLFDYENNYNTGLAYFDNTGSFGNPEFTLVTDDLFGLRNSGLYNVKTQTFDFTGDRKAELIITGTQLATGATTMYYLENTGELEFDTDRLLQNLVTGVPFASNFFWSYIDDDALPDLLLTNNGSLVWFEFTGEEFVRIEEDFKGLTGGIYDIHIDDIDNDGTEDLLYSDIGEVYVFRDFKNTDEAEKLAFTWPPGRGRTLLGIQVDLTTTNIYGQDKKQIVTSSNSGGIKIFAADDAVNIEAPDPFIVNPDLITTDQLLEVIGSRNAIIHIISTDGKTILGPEFIPADEELFYRLNNLAPGLYIVNAFLGDKESFQKKIVVID